jgi:hypothetical protein
VYLMKDGSRLMISHFVGVDNVPSATVQFLMAPGKAE